MNKWLAKLVGGEVVKTASGVADIVERWMPGAEKKHEIEKEVDQLIESSVNNARSMSFDSPGSTMFDSFVNGVNRLIRPGVTIWLLGGLGGLWALPAPGTVDPVILKWIDIVLVFWFGGRALFKDLPACIKYVKTFNTPRG